MATHLVVVEHDNGQLKKQTLSAVAAARQLGGDVHVWFRAGRFGCG